MGNIIYIKYIKCWVVTSRNVKFVEKSRTCGSFFVRLQGCKTTPTVAYQIGYTCLLHVELNKNSSKFVVS